MALLVSLAALELLLPARARSDLENRPLAQFPPPAAETVRDGRWMKQTDDAIADQFPGRGAWVSLGALWDAALLRTERDGVLLGREGWLFEPSARLNEKNAADNVSAVVALARETKLPTTLLLVPLSSAVYAEALPPCYTPRDQDALLGSLYNLAQGVRTVDVLPALRAAAARREHPLFYRLDHHWTAEGARVAFDAWRSASGHTPSPEPSCTIAADGFYGSFFARAPSPFLRPDILTFDAFEDIRLEIEGRPVDGLLDANALAGRDKYAALLYGNHGHITLVNQTAGARGTLLVIKDSFANALLPRLAQQYARVDAVDPRYFTGSLHKLAEAIQAEEMLCLYGLSTFSTDRSLQLLIGASGQ